MNIGIVTIAYNSADLLLKLFDTAKSKHHNIAFHLFLHSQHPSTVAACERLAEASNVTYYPFGVNRGISKSWNDGMLNAYDDGADIVLIVNDDIYFSAGDVDKLAKKALRCRDRYIITCAGFDLRCNWPVLSLGYSCFAINPIAIEKLGCFDENIFPAYCEDQDHIYRGRLAGLFEETCLDTNVYHARSSTIYADPALFSRIGLTAGRNVAYYRRKWGDDSGYERFAHPFNNPKFDHFIAPNLRHAPYGPDYDRSDHDVVRI